MELARKLLKEHGVEGRKGKHTPLTKDEPERFATGEALDGDRASKVMRGAGVVHCMAQDSLDSVVTARALSQRTAAPTEGIASCLKHTIRHFASHPQVVFMCIYKEEPRTCFTYGLTASALGMCAHGGRAVEHTSSAWGERCVTGVRLRLTSREHP